MTQRLRHGNPVPGLTRDLAVNRHPSMQTQEAPDQVRGGVAGGTGDAR
jgi:hypothetical protein